MVENKRKVTKAHIKATAKWEKANYDKILVRFPIGTKERIYNVSESANGFIVRVVLAALEHAEKQWK